MRFLPKTFGIYFTVRFFLDKETGATYEVRVGVRSEEGQTWMWVECSCEQWLDEYHCEHAASVEDDFDGYGGFFTALVLPDDEADRLLRRPLTTDKDAEALREVLLRFGLIEVL